MHHLLKHINQDKINLTFLQTSAKRVIANSRFLACYRDSNSHVNDFAFSLYNMPFFTFPYLLFYQRYSSEIYRQNVMI